MDDTIEKLVELLRKTEINVVDGHSVLAEICFVPSVFTKMADQLIAGGATVGKPLAEFLHPVDAYAGLKAKYLVFKGDTGERIDNCFVLRLGKDPAAVEALRAYANATDNGILAEDIYNWVGKGEPAQRWISVTERLPATSERVIVCRANGKVEQGVFLGVNGWWKVYGANTKSVTHWMPLPEAPKGE